MSRFDIVIVGAGMVGSSAALALARKGHSIAIIEREEIKPEKFQSSDKIDLRVSAISPSSQRLLIELGVWSEIQNQRCCHYHNMVVWHENGSSQMSFASEQIGVSHLGSIVENRLLQSVLLQQLKLLSNVEILSAQEVLSIQNLGQSVRVETSDHQMLESKLLIAADGRTSAVRELMGIPAMSGSYQQKAIVANVVTEQKHKNTAWQRFLSTGPLAFLPLSNGQSSIVWSADDARAEELMSLSDEDFLLQLSECFEYRLGAVTQISKRAVFPLSWHSAERWLQDRVLLIGDAAHGVHPLAGQGVNLGFADVSLLAQMIGHGEFEYKLSVLRKFERQRKAESVTAMHLFSSLKTLFGQQHPFFCGIRDLGMLMLDKNILLKRAVIKNAMHNMS